MRAYSWRPITVKAISAMKYATNTSSSPTVAMRKKGRMSKVSVFHIGLALGQHTKRAFISHRTASSRATEMQV